MIKIKKFKPVILAAIICAIICSMVGFLIFEGSLLFLPYLFLAGAFMIFIQKEQSAYKFLDKLLVGSLVFGFLTMFFVSLRMYLSSIFLGDSSFPFWFWLLPDSLLMALLFCFNSFLGGLLGIVLKGFYALYKNKLDKVIIVIGPALLMIFSLGVVKTKIGGTIESNLHGWPYPFLIHQIKDVIDGFFIDKWIFSPGSLYHYVIFDYLLYLVLISLVYFAVKLINKKLKINSTLVLFGLVILLILFLSFYSAIKESNAPSLIKESDISQTKKPISQTVKSGFEIFSDKKQGISFEYPTDLGTRYISVVDWPPIVTIESKVYSCEETPLEKSSMLEIISQQSLNGRTYCIDVRHEGAAGSVYSTYIYSTVRNDKLVSLNFTLRYNNCANYPEEQSQACTKERETFNLDETIDLIFQTLK